MMVGGDGVGYGIAARGGPIGRCCSRSCVAARSRPDHFAGRIPFEQHVAVLQRSGCACLPDVPAFVASWSLREAMACGCCIVASDTPPVQNFLTNGRTALLTPSSMRMRWLNPSSVGSRTRGSRGACCMAVRRHAERTLDIDAQHAVFDGLVQSVLRDLARHGARRRLRHQRR